VTYTEIANERKGGGEGGGGGVYCKRKVSLSLSISLSSSVRGVSRASWTGFERCSCVY
jgi:hypothetical protein